ncbi:PREDICTED: phenolic glucoside malonyltransferase 1-like [Nelumbo nucifera]|uniref:Phenolic glucoside malonyltransferase 1-like n=2 Tax=Nelumbo nucifera TaxID=4432 RepID=A0A1U8BBZ9_NELNU|nr:PREDICTED: phenolic glucoside malonyltransferase 1-like [Nelumbo nucifera]DAD32626.1 TPA_asm: hypothetical protein HUJ06_011477 [Nelumbo nucifera]
MEPPTYRANILEHCRIAPPPNSATEMSLPLTFFDMLCLVLPPIQSLYFYELPQFADSLLPNIKHSLSLTLKHFLPFAGNLTWPKDSEVPLIRYVEKDSVSLTVAESDGDFYHLSGTHCRDITEILPLIPDLPISDKQAPVLALQVTVFPNRGICVATTIHHAVADGRTISLFMKTWASICRLGGDSSLLPESLPFYDRNVIKDPSGLQKVFLTELSNLTSECEVESENWSFKLWDNVAPPNSVKAIFELRRDDIERLRKWVVKRLAKDKQSAQDSVPHLSAFVLACAFLCHCLVTAGEDESREKTYCMFPVDCRARLEPPVPATYFGNCVRGGIVSLETNRVLGEDGMVVAVEAIRGAINELENGVLRGLEEFVSAMSSIDVLEIIWIAWSPRFRVYDTNFGWERPKKMEILMTAGCRVISLVESRDGDGGIEVGLELDRKQMQVFSSLFVDGIKAL